MIKCVCFHCGTEFVRYPHEAKNAPRVWCSQSCHMKTLNLERNPTRWQDENRDHAAHRGRMQKRGQGKTYRKHYGRHEHRVVAEQILGRPLKLGEVVHHLNGDKTDNRPENLKIYASQAEHMRDGHPRVGGRWSK